MGIVKEEEIYVFYEPHHTGGCCIVEITRTQAIAFQKKIAWDLHTYKYATDEDALRAFIGTNWATKKEQTMAQQHNQQIREQSGEEHFEMSNNKIETTTDGTYFIVAIVILCIAGLFYLWTQ